LQFRSEPSWAPETLVPRTGLTSASSLVLAPNDFNDVAEVAQTLNVFERHYDEIASPVRNWPNYSNGSTPIAPKSSQPNSPHDHDITYGGHH
jgi:hypothetical protein